MRDLSGVRSDKAAAQAVVIGASGDFAEGVTVPEHSMDLPNDYASKKDTQEKMTAPLGWRVATLSRWNCCRA